MNASPAPVEVFCSYASTDILLYQRLEMNLSALSLSGERLVLWHRSRVTPGDPWEQVRDAHLNQAPLILLLISPAFLADPGCRVEMQRALERYDAGNARVIPILLRPAATWKSTPLGRLEALPDNTRAITKWDNRDVAFNIVTEGIRVVLEEIRRLPVNTPPGSLPPVGAIPETILEQEQRVNLPPVEPEPQQKGITRRAVIPLRRFGGIFVALAFLILVVVIIWTSSGPFSFFLHSKVISHATATTPTIPVTDSDSSPMLGVDASHAHFNRGEHLLSASTVPQLRQAWTSAQGTLLLSSPVVSNGMVYIRSDDGRIFVYPATGCGTTTCSPLWSTQPILQGITFSPAVSTRKGVLYIGTTDGRLYAYPANGCKKSPCGALWSSAPGSRSPASSPTIANGLVYVTIGNEVYAYTDAASGCGRGPCDPLWSSLINRFSTAGSSTDSSPAVDGSVLSVGVGDRMYVFNAFGCGNGNSKCSYLRASSPIKSDTIDGTVASALSAVDGVIYLSVSFGTNARIYAYKAAGCSKQPTFGKTYGSLWFSPPISGAPSALAVADGFVYVGIGMSLYAFPVSNEKGVCPQPIPTIDPLWRSHTLVGTVTTPTVGTVTTPTVANGIIYIGVGSKLYAYQTRHNAIGCPNQTCEALWISPSLTGTIVSAPVVVHGTIYVSTTAGHLYAFSVGT